MISLVLGGIFTDVLSGAVALLIGSTGLLAALPTMRLSSPVVPSERSSALRPSASSWASVSGFSLS
jgi:hypothetical protein